MDPELRRLLFRAVDEIARMRATYDRWRPASSLPALVQPFYALAAVLSVALTFGISLAALSTLLVSLLVLQFLLVEVFGISLDIQGA